MGYHDLDTALSDWVMTMLSTDSVVQALTGGRPSTDPRVYWFYQADAVLTVEYPAYISFAQMSSGRERGGVTEPVYSFRVYAYDLAVCQAIVTRMNQLFDGVVNTLGAGTVTSEKVQASDLFDQANKFAGREVHYSFGVQTAGVA